MPVECPISGCTGGPFSTENGAVMHLINSSRNDPDDPHHAVTSKAEGYAMLGGQDPDPQPTPTSDGGTDADGGGQDPAKAGPSGETYVSPGDGSSETCPECGGEVDTDVAGTFYQPTEADPGEYVRAEEGDGLCRSCGLLVSGDEAVALEAQS